MAEANGVKVVAEEEGGNNRVAKTSKAVTAVDDAEEGGAPMENQAKGRNSHEANSVVPIPIVFTRLCQR